MASDSEEEFFDAAAEVPSPVPVKDNKQKATDIDNIVQVSNVRTKDQRTTGDSENINTGDSDVQPTSTKPTLPISSTCTANVGDGNLNDITLKPADENASDVKSKLSPKPVYGVVSENKDNTGDTPPPVAPPRRKKQQKKEAIAKAKVKVETVESIPSIAVTNATAPRDDTDVEVEMATTTEKQSTQPFITVNAYATEMNEVLQRGGSLDVVVNDDTDECRSPTKKAAHSEHKKEDSKSSESEEDHEKLKEMVRGTSQSGRPLSDIEILEQVVITNLDTGDQIPLSLAEEKIPQATNPLALHIMTLTSDFSNGKSKLSTVEEDDHLSDASTALSVKLEGKRKKLKKFLGKTVQKIKDEVKARQKEDSSSSDEDELHEDHYVKYKSHKGIRDRLAFDKLRLLQDLSGDHIGAIWTMKFSLCGRLLATAGQDTKVRVYVLKDAHSFFVEMKNKYSKSDRSSSPTSSITSTTSATSIEEEPSLDDSLAYSADMGPFRRVPFISYEGHTSDVLDLSWSKNYFILSSSMDKTVRLWHISRRECLCCFQHVDFVTAICFHPRDDRYFLSGSLDGKLRLWNIPEKKVALWNEIDGSGTSLITAANFCQNGKLAVVGTYDGRCIFYDTERLKYHTQVTVRSTRGKNARGRKVSGIEPMPGEDKVLITSNDSRIRLYDLKDHSLYCKYKGGENTSSQIKASFNHDGQYIICGSEDHFIYIWKMHHGVLNVRKDRNEYYESFSAHDAVVTAAVFAPLPDLIIVPPPRGKETDEEESTNQSEILVTADWSGGVKLFVNR